MNADTVTLAERITKTPDICGGDACMRGHRIPVWVLVSYRLLGASDADMLVMYPTINAADVAAAWKYYDSHREEIDGVIREEDEGYEDPLE